ncbi:HK97 gp10 family phage protein [Staphylococcus equorum]|uniref:HK97-gp10 family putative phage morphogenesis protein n=1 Tax=Staphylococcus equorum TaxID=246432 RepID=UPI002407C016|nr:HK97-gp10 family putative phage morphogenesis protein [Staphylococcus equorum]MDG0843159.1 HK97 gp10 family phage protein [Staphylococcus equorum]
MAKVKYGNWDLVAELEEYKRETEKWAKKGIAKTVNVIHNTAVSLAPVDEGFLKESINFEYKDSGLTGVIEVGASYAIYVEYGTGIYAVGPGGSRAKKIPWAYQDPKTGKWYMTKGMQAQPFWGPAIDAGRETFKKYFS